MDGTTKKESRQKEGFSSLNCTDSFLLFNVRPTFFFLFRTPNLFYSRAKRRTRAFCCVAQWFRSVRHAKPHHINKNNTAFVFFNNTFVDLIHSISSLICRGSERMLSPRGGGFLPFFFSPLYFITQ